MHDDAGHDDHVASLEQGVRGGVAEPVDLVVARRVLLDVGVAAGQVRLGLVVVEVADEVLDRVLREELAELGVELGGQRLVVGEDQRRLVVPARSSRRSCAVLPVPVAPSRVWWLTPLARPSIRRSIAAGWSPVGSNGATNLKSGIVSSLPCLAHEPNRCSARLRAARSTGPPRPRMSLVDERLRGCRPCSLVSIDPGRDRDQPLGRCPPGGDPLVGVRPPTCRGRLSRARCVVGSQVTSQTSSHSCGQPALDELDRLDDDGRGAVRVGPLRSRRGSAAGPPDGRSPRGRAGRPGSAKTIRPRAARSSDPSGRRRASPNRSKTASSAGSPGSSDLAGDAVGVDDDDARPLAEPAPRRSTCRSRSAR